MTEERRQEIQTEVTETVIGGLIDACNAYGGVLEVAKNADLDSEMQHRYNNAAKAAERHKDEDGKVNPHVQAILARIYGLI